MYIKLAGCFRYIQIVLKEFIDGGQCFFVERIRQIFAENLRHKHFTQRNRKLINQTADTKVVVRYHIFVCVENFSYLERHLRFFVGT